MAHFGILCPPIPGHLNPMIALGCLLKKRGHSVSVVGWDTTLTIVEVAGLNFIPLESKKSSHASTPADFSIKAVLRRLWRWCSPWKSADYSQASGLQGSRQAIRALKQWSNVVLKEAPTVIKQNHIDVLLVSEILYGAGTVADHLKIPHITVSLGIPRHRTPKIPPYVMPWFARQTPWSYLRNSLVYQYLDWLNAPVLKLINQYRHSWELPLHKQLGDEDSTLAKIVQLPAALDFPENSSPQIFFTGPYTNYSTQPYKTNTAQTKQSFPFEQLTNQPLVYASIGTLANREDVYRCIAAACRDLDVQLVISLGGKGNVDAFADLPGNPIVVNYVPMPDILHRANLVISHGGINTTLEALHHGVPLVIIPIVLDQPGMAARVKSNGAGEFISLKALNAKRLGTMIQHVLKTPVYRAKAVQMKTLIEQSGGTAKAVEVIENVLDISTARFVEVEK